MISTGNIETAEGELSPFSEDDVPGRADPADGENLQQ